MNEFQAYLALPFVQAVITGLVGGVAVDIVAFRKFQSWNEFAEYQWDLAAWRAFQGAAGGVLGYFGLVGLQTIG